MLRTNVILSPPSIAGAKIQEPGMRKIDAVNFRARNGPSSCIEQINVHACDVGKLQVFTLSQ